MFDYKKISPLYKVKKINLFNIKKVEQLFKENQHYFDYLKEDPSIKYIKKDIKELPEGKTKKDKYYLGLFGKQGLVCVLDLVDGYPKPDVFYIGLFIIKKEFQNQGTGSFIYKDLEICLRNAGYKKIRLGYVENNVEGEGFWEEMGFKRTGEIKEMYQYNIVAMEKIIY